MQAQLARRVHPSERDDDLLQGQRLLFVQARGLTKGVDSESTNLKVRPSSSQVLDLTRPSSDVRIDVVPTAVGGDEEKCSSEPVPCGGNTLCP